MRKPAVTGTGGLVAAQHAGAAEVGARVLEGGGNAVDAALAASLALCVLEPWMSGLGGGGFMVIAKPDGAAEVIDFGMVAPARLDPAAYPLVDGRDDELFGWPAVLEQRNLLGPLSIAVPGQAAGLGLAYGRHASMPWADLAAPAIALARRGLPVTWYATLRIAGGAGDLIRFDGARDVYLPGGLPPVPNADGTPVHLSLGRLGETLERLAEAGPQDLATGELAHLLAHDVEAAGGMLASDDLARYRARPSAPTADRPCRRDLRHAGRPDRRADLCACAGALGRRQDPARQAWPHSVCRLGRGVARRLRRRGSRPWATSTTAGIRPARRICAWSTAPARWSA